MLWNNFTFQVKWKVNYSSFVSCQTILTYFWNVLHNDICSDSLQKHTQTLSYKKKTPCIFYFTLRHNTKLPCGTKRLNQLSYPWCSWWGRVGRRSLSPFLQAGRNWMRSWMAFPELPGWGAPPPSCQGKTKAARSARGAGRRVGEEAK